MDRYEWTGTAGQRLYVAKDENGFLDTTAGPDDLEAQEELLLLARRVEDREAEILRLAERAKALEEDARAATMTIEEGNEIDAELSMALAVLAGESLAPCTEPCAGHLGPKAAEAMAAALAAWHALQEGNRAAAERIKALEGEGNAGSLANIAEVLGLTDTVEPFGPYVLGAAKATVQAVATLSLRVAGLEAHEDATRKQLRIECEELGDNEWPDDLHLADVIEKHMARPVAARIAELEAQVEAELRGQVELSEGSGRAHDVANARIAELDEENRNLSSRNRELLALVAERKDDGSRYAAAGRTIRDLEEENRALREERDALRATPSEKDRILHYMKEAAEECRRDGDVRFCDYTENLRQGIIAGDHLPAPEPTRYSPAVPMDRLREGLQRSAAVRAYLDAQPRPSRPWAFKCEPLTPEGAASLGESLKRDAARFDRAGLAPDHALFPERYGAPQRACTHPYHFYRGLDCPCPRCGERLGREEPVARPSIPEQDAFFLTSDGEKIPCRGPPPAAAEGVESVAQRADLGAGHEATDRYEGSAQETIDVLRTDLASMRVDRNLWRDRFNSFRLVDPARHASILRLEALLASEEVPEGLKRALGHALGVHRWPAPAVIAWRWFREQFGQEAHAHPPT